MDNITLYADDFSKLCVWYEYCDLIGVPRESESINIRADFKSAMTNNCHYFVRIEYTDDNELMCDCKDMCMPVDFATADSVYEYCKNNKDKFVNKYGGKIFIGIMRTMRDDEDYDIDADYIRDMEVL